MNNKACFVVPFINKPKDEMYVKIFIESMFKYDLEDFVFFIINDENALNFLQSVSIKLDNKKKIHTIIVKNSENWYGNNQNTPTIKKFIGLQVLYKNYDYIATIDADFKFLKSFDPYQVMNEIWENKSCFFRNNCELHNQILMRNCAYLCGLENNENLIKETKDFTYSCWFNDIPVYNTQHWEEFSKWMCETKISNGRTPFYNAKYNFSCFDYWMYWFWLISFKGLHNTGCSDYTRFNSIIESLNNYGLYLTYIDHYLNEKPNLINIELLKVHKEKILNEILYYEKMINTHWTTRDYDKTKDIMPNNQLCIQFNCDRAVTRFIDELNFKVRWNI